MTKKILAALAWAVSFFAGIAKILSYCNLPSQTVFGKIAAAGQTTISLPVGIIVLVVSCTLAYLLGIGRFRSHKPLVIHSATYGAGSNVVDVTAKLASLIRDNSLTVVAGNHLAGDPINGTVKHLDVWYSYGTSQRKAIVCEGRTLELP